MRYMPAILAKLFPPLPLPAAPLAPTPMDSQLTDARASDPISRELHDAVTEHERTGADIGADYNQRLRSTIDELLEHLGQRHDDPTG